MPVPGASNGLPLTAPGPPYMGIPPCCSRLCPSVRRVRWQTLISCRRRYATDKSTLAICQNLRGLLMPVRPSPTVRGRRLRYELRRLREQRTMTIEQVAVRSGGDWTASAISRWETGDRGIRPGGLRARLDIYDVQGSEREVLLTLAREARARGWWQSYSSDAVPEWFQFYLGLEAEASSIQEYGSELVPGLLQTEDYYRAFMSAAPAAGDAQAIDRKLAVRSGRQERLTSDDAPEVWAVL